VKTEKRKFAADSLLWEIGLVNLPSPNPKQKDRQQAAQINGKRLKVIFDTILR
jgi:hypothetical protein